jgi:hypothetical protein
VKTVELINEVRALSPNQREAVFYALLEGEESAQSAPFAKAKRVKWPDVQKRAKRIFGEKVFPNLVLLERSEQSWQDG